MRTALLSLLLLAGSANAGGPYYGYASCGYGGCGYQAPYSYFPAGVYAGAYGGKAWFPAGYYSGFFRYGYGIEYGIQLPVAPNSIQVLTLPAGLPPVQIAPAQPPTMTGTAPAPNPNQLTAEEVQQLRAILAELRTERAPPVAKTK